MKILVSNDDGIAANGIRCLTETLAQEHKVYVIAPDRERSAAGHSLTLHTPLRVEEVEAYHGVKRAWVTTGTPGDCVKIGINAILSKEEQPDIVISGINHGPNLGADILYSGTVSCAMEGHTFVIAGIHITQYSFLQLFCSAWNTWRINEICFRDVYKRQGLHYLSTNVIPFQCLDYLNLNFALF